MNKNQKTNIRSFRYSDRVASILESMEGANLNAKFENLVLFCNDKFPEVEKRYRTYQSMAASAFDDYMELSDLRHSIQRELTSINNCLCSLDELLEHVEAQCRKVKEYEK